MTPSITNPEMNHRRAGGVFHASSRPLRPARDAATNPMMRSAVDATRVATATQKKVKEPVARLYALRLVSRSAIGYRTAATAIPSFPPSPAASTCAS